MNTQDFRLQPSPPDSLSLRGCLERVLLILTSPPGPLSPRRAGAGWQVQEGSARRRRGGENALERLPASTEQLSKNALGARGNKAEDRGASESPNIKAPTLEIAVTTLEDALQAAAGGARSIEISRDLALGGLTPAIEIVEAARAAVSLEMHVIVRPHARDFVYSTAEVDTILRDIDLLKSAGINGIVFGAHNRAGEINIALMQQVAEAAAPLPVTLHRALDSSRNPEAALKALIGLVPRILTAGPAASAWEGREGLRQWVQTYGDHYEFVSSGGLTLEQLPVYIPTVQADVYHFGSAARTDGMVDAVKVAGLLRAIQLH
jgi:copper homeostasis protein